MATLDIADVTTEFVQIGHELTMWNRYAANNVNNANGVNSLPYVETVAIKPPGSNPAYFPVFKDGDKYLAYQTNGNFYKIIDMDAFKAGNESAVIKLDARGDVYDDGDEHYSTRLLDEPLIIEIPGSAINILYEFFKCDANGKPLLNGGAVNGPSLTSAANTFYVRGDYQISDCYSIVPCFGIDNNIYQQLVNRYINTALTFPTQTIAVYPMANSLKGVSCSSTQTITPRFVDSIFILFPLSTTHRTVYKNPLFKSVQLRCGGYGSVPAVPFSTQGDDPAFIEYAQNAMNVNGLQTGFNKEVVKSLCNSDVYDASTSSIN